MQKSAQAMRNIFQDITRFARSKSSSEWKSSVWQKLDDLRVLVRDHGEKAALVGFGIGVGVVLFFKLFLVLTAIAALAFLTVLWLSES